MKKFHIGDQVRVKKTIFKNDPESDWYVNEKFIGKVGQLFDVTRSSKGVPSFHVNFGNEIGIFHEDEIEYVTT